ncbi:beta-galactosidase [Allostreptomyces psammosilenae]|nr:beta-galactosidase [Allostreptomyces psammosilenae]
MSDAPGAPNPVAVTSGYLTRAGRPFVPVSGEFHYSRYPREHWERELLKIKAGGITAVASYLIWIHHEEVEGRPSFEGNLDVRHFAELCARHGLDFVARIGPWVHAETRNGGLPDWLLDGRCEPRTDDAAYLAHVRRWFTAIAEELRGLDTGSGGPLLAVQIENELYDAPGHLLTLKRLAQEVGLRAPLWTATGWGGAHLPPDELLPLFGGYPEAFWAEAEDGWDDTCRAHFHFSHERDDPGIGADLREEDPRRSNLALDRYPSATCELGGGMAAAYHRRPLVDGDDVAALALTKIGGGSNWQGYYMYHGGTNPPGRLTPLQESQDTGYPNDLPRLSYDFQAPLGEFGQYRDGYHRLRAQHLMLADFGERLAPMVSVLPEARPDDCRDRHTLRWALRTDGRSGFLFVNNHQMYEPLPDHQDVRFHLELPGGAQVTLPSQPVTIPSGAYFCWPVGLEVDGLRIAWATAQPVCRIPAGDGAARRTTLVLVATEGVPVELALEADTVADLTAPAPLPGHADGRAEPRTDADGRLLLTGLRPGTDCRVTVRTPGGAGVDLLVLDAASGAGLYRGRLWGADRVVLSEEGVTFEDGPAGLTLHSGAPRPSFAVLPAPAGTPEVAGARLEAAADGCLTRYTLRPDAPIAAAVPLALEELRPAGDVPPTTVGPGGRARTPGDEVFETAAAVYRLRVPEELLDGPDQVLLRVEWTGDVGRAYRDGRLVADTFWQGRPWELDARALGLGRDGGTELELRLLPLRADAPVHLSERVRPDFGGAPAVLAVHTVTALTTRAWTVRLAG